MFQQPAVCFSLPRSEEDEGNEEVSWIGINDQIREYESRRRGTVDLGRGSIPRRANIYECFVRREGRKENKVVDLPVHEVRSGRKLRGKEKNRMEEFDGAGKGTKGERSFAGRLSRPTDRPIDPWGQILSFEI